MKHFKHFALTVLLALVGSMSASAYDFTAMSNQTIYFNILSDNTCEVTYKNENYKSYSGEVVIPSTVTYTNATYTVTSISSNAFKDCNSLLWVEIPNTVTTIGENAFYGCTNLNSFYGKFASDDNRCLIIDGTLRFFAPAGLYSYSIPSSVTSIGAYAFANCTNLRSITLPNSLTSIGDYGFYRCASLQSITFPNSLTSIGDYGFYNCTTLQSITFPNSLNSIGVSGFHYCTGLQSVTMSNSVTSIGDDAFKSCSNLKSVYISDLSAWCQISFSNANSTPLLEAKNLYLNGELITDIEIPNSVTTIGDYVFYLCSSLTSVRIPNTVTYL